MATLDDIIDNDVLALAQARGSLSQLMHALQSGMEALKADHMPGIRAAVYEAEVCWKALKLQIELHPHLFEKPRTAVAHGIKFGLAKGKGGLNIPDPDKTVLLIRKHLPEQAEVLISVKETPAKEALALLPAADLKRIGVQVVDSGDQVVIKPADGEVDKLVKVLLKAAVEADGDGEAGVAA